MLSTPWKKRIAAICSMMLALLLVFGTAVPAHAASYGTVGETGNANSTWHITLITAVIILVGVNICLVMILRKQNKERAGEQEKFDEKYRRLQKLKNETAHSLTLAEKDIAVLEDWQARAIGVNPGIQAMINNQIYKERADKFARDYLDVELEGLEPYKAYDVLDKIFSAYRALAPEVKELVEYNMDALKKTFEDVTSNYIQGAVQYLVEVNKTTKGRFEEMETLKAALEYFDALPYAIQKAVPERIVSKLRMKKANAEMYLPLDTFVDEDEE